MLVKNIQGCCTGQIDGLSNQLLKRLVDKGYLEKINHPLIICEGRHNNPYLQPIAYRALVKAVEKVKQKIVINSCLRTVMQQHLLRKQYLQRKCGITAAAIPGRSNHQSGSAIDIADWLFWRSPLQAQGWKWLGAWDKWHYDYRHSGSHLGTIQIKLWQELWNEHNDYQLQLKVDGIWGPKTANSVDNSPAEGFKKFPSFKRGDINKAVGQFQLLLRSHLKLSAADLPADCAYGGKTMKAVAYFQTIEGLPATGIADPQTIKRLYQRTDKYSEVESGGHF